MNVSSPHPNFTAWGLSSHEVEGIQFAEVCDGVISDPWQGASLLDEGMAVSPQIPSSCPNSCLLLRMLKFSEVSPKMKVLRESHSLRMSVLMLSL